MGSLVIRKGMKINRTPEQIAEIEALKNLKDEEIDLSDIPEITHEEWQKHFRPARLRKQNLKLAS